MSFPTAEGVDGRSMNLTARTASTGSKVTVTWVIENFSLLVEGMKATFAVNQADAERSDDFSDDGNRVIARHKFPIQIDVAGDHVDLFEATLILANDFETVGLYMQLVDRRQSSQLLAKIKARVITDDGAIPIDAEESTLTNFGDLISRGWTEFLQISDLDNCLDSNEALNLILIVSHFVPPGEVKPAKNVFETTTHFNNCLSAFRDPEYTDYEIKVTEGTGKTFKCHKFILSAQSPVFRAMFRSESIESSTGVVEIPDVSADVMQLFLEWIYCGRFSGDLDDLSGPPAWVESVPKLLEVADKYCVQSLVQFCDENLIRAVTKKNVLDLIMLANRLSLAKASEDITNYISKNVKAIFSIDKNEEMAELGGSEATEAEASAAEAQSLNEVPETGDA